MHGDRLSHTISVRVGDLGARYEGLTSYAMQCWSMLRLVLLVSFDLIFSSLLLHTMLCCVCFGRSWTVQWLQGTTASKRRLTGLSECTAMCSGGPSPDLHSLRV